MPNINDALLEELQALFTKYDIAHAFLAIPKHDERHYVLLPYQMGVHEVRHLAMSLLHNPPATPPTLN